MGENIFPYGAKLNRVISILRILHEKRGRVELRELARISKLNHDALIPLVQAARELELVDIKEGYIILTKRGEGLNIKDTKAISEIRERLKRYEPFKSSIELVERDGAFSVDGLEGELNRGGIIFHTNLTRSKGLLAEALIQWAIFFKLLGYDSRHKIWVKPKVHHSPAA